MMPHVQHLWLGAAWAGTIWGGGITTVPQVHTEAGLPHVEVGVRLPVSRTVELTPRARMTFLRGLMVDWSFTIGLDIRVMLADVGGFHAALSMSTPFIINPIGRGVRYGFVPRAAVVSEKFP